MLNKQKKIIYAESATGRRRKRSANILPANLASRYPSSDSDIFSPEALYRLEELGNTLREIYKRIRKEGFEIKNGVLLKTKDYEKNKSKN